MQIGRYSRIAPMISDAAIGERGPHPCPLSSCPCLIFVQTPCASYFMPPSLVRSPVSLIRALAWSAEAGHVLI